MRSLFRRLFLGLICLLLIASSDAAVNMYGYRSGRSLVTAQGGGVVTVNPGAYQTPDPGQGGLGVASPSNLGHGNTAAAAPHGATRTKSCKWTGFQTVSGQVIAITLKVDWSEDGSAGGGGSSNQFQFQYSTNNGSSWNTLFQHNNVNFPGSGTAQVALSSGQDISQVQVRDKLTAISTLEESASVIGSVLNIRLEVETVNCIASVPADRWKGEYFSNQNPSGSPAMVRDDSTPGTDFLNINFGGASPNTACGIGADNFSARWTRMVNFAAGTYLFIATVDNGVKLYVDGISKINQWGNPGLNTFTAEVTLSANHHEIKLEFVEYTGDAGVSLYWIDASCLASVPGGNWRGEYFNNITLTGHPVTGFPAMVRNDGTGFLNFNFGNGGPGGNCGLGVDNFSARWTRTVDFGPGVYRFSVTGDDGVRLYVGGGQPMIDAWFSQGATTYTANVTFSSAGPREVKLEYFESGGPGVAILTWVDLTGVNCLPDAPLPLISSVPQTGGRENIASTAPSQTPKRCDPKIVTPPRAPGSD